MTIRNRSWRQLTLRTSGPDDTRELAATVASALALGDAVILTGELGAGKTCFVQGAAGALGVERPVTSPTFTIVRPYQGFVPVVHVDIYRLDLLQDFIELGEENVLSPQAVTFIEWGDTVDVLLPEDRLEVELLLADGDSERIVHLRGYGEWSERLVDLVGDLARWLLDDPYRSEQA